MALVSEWASRLTVLQGLQFSRVGGYLGELALGGCVCLSHKSLPRYYYKSSERARETATQRHKHWDRMNNLVVKEDQIVHK